MQENYYHIHVTADRGETPKGWKETSIVLEKNDRIENHQMYTKTIKGAFNDINKDVNDFKERFEDLFTNITRFKVELLNQPDYVEEYTETCYREVHIKVEIDKKHFESFKSIMRNLEDEYGFSLSNNPKEITSDIVTQFVNMRFLTGGVEISNFRIALVLKLIYRFEDIGVVEINEIKDELSVYDNNFTLDKWWAH